MADSTLNIVDPATRDAATTAGDVPDRVKRRYLTDDRNGPGLGFYVDASVSTPAFRDRGHRLSTDRNDPNVVRDLVAIAQHRGWTIIGVRGQTNFRREVWIAARAAGLEVRGYRPTERDVQDLARRTERARGRPAAEAERPDFSVRHRADPGPSTRMRIVEAVVKDRIVEPAARPASSPPRADASPVGWSAAPGSRIGVATTWQIGSVRSEGGSAPMPQICNLHIANFQPSLRRSGSNIVLILLHKSQRKMPV